MTTTTTKKGKKKKKKKKRTTPPQGEGAPAPPVFVVPSAGLNEDEGEPEEPAGASVEPDEEPDEREAAEVGSVRQWAIDKHGSVTGHVSEEDVRASLHELAVNVAAVAQQPGGCSEDDLSVSIEDPFYLLQHFLELQAPHGRHDGRYEGILRDLGINTPLEVLDVMDLVIFGEVAVDITTLDEVLQTICDPPVSAP